MPMPVSLTVSTTLPSSRPSDSRTVPFSGVNLMALLSRFQITCCIRA